MHMLTGLSEAHHESSTTLAATYVHMSTEHQQYSKENKLDVIRIFAATHALEIVRSTRI